MKPRSVASTLVIVCGSFCACSGGSGASSPGVRGGQDASPRGSSGISASGSQSALSGSDNGAGSGSTSGGGSGSAGSAGSGSAGSAGTSSAGAAGSGGGTSAGSGSAGSAGTSSGSSLADAGQTNGDAGAPDSSASTDGPTAPNGPIAIVQGKTAASYWSQYNTCPPQTCYGNPNWTTDTFVMGRQYLDPHTPSSTPSSDQPITLANVQQGNALLYVVAAYFAPANGQPVLPIDPTDSNGAWTKGVQDKASVPLHTQIYYELNANAGTHTITPGPAGFFGDGRLWVIEVSGISSPVTSGSAFTSGTAIPSQSVSTAAAVGVGDFVIAVGTEDGNPGSANPQFSVANGAWMSIGSEQDGINCVAIEARYSIATSATVQTVQWSWPGDTTAATSAASIIAFKPAH